MHDSFLRGNAWWCRLRGGGWSQNHYIERWLYSLTYKMYKSIQTRCIPQIKSQTMQHALMNLVNTTLSEKYVEP